MADGVPASGLLTDLERRGIRLAASIDGTRLKVAPASALTDADRQAIRAHKPELLALLASHHECAKTVAREAEAAGTDLSDYCRQRAPELLNGAVLDPGPSPGKSIIETCLRYGVALRIDADGDLVVGKAGAKGDEPTQPWRSLLIAIEAHLETVARLVAAGWTLKAGFPSERAPA